MVATKVDRAWCGQARTRPGRIHEWGLGGSDGTIRGFPWWGRSPPPPPGLLQGRPPHIPLRSFLFNQPWSDPSLVEKTVQPHPQLPQGRCIRHVVDWDRRGEPRRRPRRINARRGEASTSKGRDEGRRERTNRTVRLCQPNATPSVDPSTRQPTTW